MKVLKPDKQGQHHIKYKYLKGDRKAYTECGLLPH